MHAANRGSLALNTAWVNLCLVNVVFMALFHNELIYRSSLNVMGHWFFGNLAYATAIGFPFANALSWAIFMRFIGTRDDKHASLGIGFCITSFAAYIFSISRIVDVIHGY